MNKLVKSINRENVFSVRLASARKMAGLSLQGLSDKLGNKVSKQALNKYEQGKMKPDSRGLIALANALKVSADYFYSVPTVNAAVEEAEFRKHGAKLSKSDDAAVREKVRDSFERCFELEGILNLNEKSDGFVFESIIKTAEDAEEAAKKLRNKWKLGHDPIPDVVAMLEDKGYRVIDIDAPAGFEGMKARIAGRKIIALKKTNDIEKGDIVGKRFTALHELAHHALRFPKDISPKDKEALCCVFAGAVLYPEDMARKELRQERFHFYERELIIIKERWGISFSAIFYRAKRLGILNNNVLQKFNAEFKKRGYHLPNAEPGRFRSREKPARMERLVYLGLAKEALTINALAFFAGISAWKLREKMRLMV